MSIPKEQRRIALALLSDEKLQAALEDPRVTPELKADVQEEIDRRRCRCDLRR